MENSNSNMFEHHPQSGPLVQEPGIGTAVTKTESEWRTVDRLRDQMVMGMDGRMRPWYNDL